jgi:DNA polymerase III subunit epsilon
MYHDFIVIDFETACPSHDSPCSLGLIVVRQLEITSEQCYLINPKIDKWSPINIGIHRIYPEMVANSPEFDIIWPDIKHFFQDSLVVAHNISFDCSVLTKTLERYKLPRPYFQTSCTL